MFYCGKGKVQIVLAQAIKAQGGVKIYFHSFSIVALEVHG